jgi:hypothetical protein
LDLDFLIGVQNLSILLLTIALEIGMCKAEAVLILLSVRLSNEKIRQSGALLAL